MAARTRHRLAAAAVALVVAATAVVAAGGLGVGPRLSDGAGEPVSQGPAGVKPPTFSAGLSLRSPPPAALVLAPAEAVGVTSGALLRRHLAAALAVPGLSGLGMAVSALGSSRPVLRAGTATVTPASAMKLLTTTATLATLGPAHRFTTTVVQGSTRGSVVLVGGGDPLLADAAAGPPVRAGAATDVDLYPPVASLQSLAAATADRLIARGVRRVRLGFDASLFTGPAVNPRWPSTYVRQDVVSPISALWADEGRTVPGSQQRSADPARAAALAFRDRLRQVGITVINAVPRRVAPGPNAGVVASVSSAPLDQIVEHVLETSDNEGAEVLLRQLAVAGGRPGSAVAGVAAVRRALTSLGLDLSGATFYDGSGLSREDRLPVRLLLNVLQAAASAEHPGLRAVVTGLPVAGFNGSLAARFSDRRLAGSGLGYVRAKTGTLSGVAALAGLALTRTGQVLVFVVIADTVPVPATLEARDGLDALAAALTTCGC